MYDNLIFEKISEAFKIFGEDFNWVALQNGEIFNKEIKNEMTQTHPLYNRSPNAVAKSYSTDDVLFLLNDSQCAIVHLTYSKNLSPKWPGFTLFSSVDKAIDYIIDEYKNEFL